MEDGGDLDAAFCVGWVLRCESGSWGKSPVRQFFHSPGLGNVQRLRNGVVKAVAFQLSLVHDPIHQTQSIWVMG